MDKKPDLKFSHDSLQNDVTLGVLLCNLGSTATPDHQGLRSFYSSFLADSRVIEVPRAIWLVILYGFILPFRPFAIAKQYKSIWTDEGSPLLVISKRQKDAVQASLDKELGKGKAKVALGMRYGEPSIANGLKQLKDAGAKRIIVLPLYPQPAAPTTATTFDAVSDALRSWRDLPPVRFVSGYADEPLFVRAVADSVRKFWAENNNDLPQRLLLSFHGVPQQTLLAGDPYHCWCLKTARLIAKELGLPYYNADNNPHSFPLGGGKSAEFDGTTFGISFQSRFGFAEWVKPYSAATLEQWAKDGVESVDSMLGTFFKSQTRRFAVVAPAFSADCLETLEEISGQLKELFLEHGGKRLRYIPALNDSPDAVKLYSELVLRNTLGWPEQRLFSKPTLQRVLSFTDEPEHVGSGCPHLQRTQSAVSRATELDVAPLASDLRVLGQKK